MHSLLDRRVRYGLDDTFPLNSSQMAMDQLLSRSVDFLEDPYALTAMALAPLSGAWSRAKVFAGCQRWLAGTASRVGSRALAVSVGFATELVSYEAMQRSLRVFLGNGNVSLLSWQGPLGFKEGLFHSALSFGAFKTSACLGRNTNIFFQHFLTDSALVASHRMLGNSEKSWLQEFVQAETMNWRIKGGMSIFQGPLARRLAMAGLEDPGLSSRETWKMQRFAPKENLATLSAGSYPGKRQKGPHFEQEVIDLFHLAKERHPEAIPALLERHPDHPIPVRHALRKLASAFKVEEAFVALAKLAKHDLGALAILLTIGHQDIPLVLETLRNLDVAYLMERAEQDLASVSYALFRLGSMRNQAAVTALSELARSNPELVRPFVPSVKPADVDFKLALVEALKLSDPGAP